MTGGVLIGTPCSPRARVSRTRGFGARSRNNCGCIWAVAVLGFAKANDGASASHNAMEILNLISNSCRLPTIGRAERWPGFKFPLTGIPQQAFWVYSYRGSELQYRRARAGSHYNSPPRYTNSHYCRPFLSAFVLLHFYVSTCNSLAIKAYWSTVASMRLLSGIPAPCPARVSTRIRIGFGPDCAACRAAVYLKLWAG